MDTGWRAENALVVPYSWEELKEATNNFSVEENLVREDIDYQVFKGDIDNDVSVAVIKYISERRRHCSYMERQALSYASDHPNIIKLLGYCVEHHDHLVLEFVPNGSLHDHLHKTQPLNWTERKKIAIGIAKALAYLHNLDNMVIHGRITSQNILLDNDLVPKVSNFHLAVVLESGVTQLPWDEWEIEMLYHDPDFSDTKKISDKMDVYSFGVLLMELITGRESDSVYTSGRPSELPAENIKQTRSLLQQVLLVSSIPPRIDNEDVDAYVDTKLNGEFNASELDKMISLAKCCLDYSSMPRPTAKEIVETLENIWNELGGEAKLSDSLSDSLSLPDLPISLPNSPHLPHSPISRPDSPIRCHPDSPICLLDSPQNNDEFIEYSYDELAEATGYFNQKSNLGKGGFGEVFMGNFPDDNNTVAIKKLLYCEQQGKHFTAELSVLAQLRHPNLVKMLGYCSDDDNNRLIVLELMPNKSLLSHLHVDCDQPVLEWSKRMSIAKGSAKGITYLHDTSDHDMIVHRDIKPGNILLDHDFEPKIADFGLARFMQYDKSHISTDSYATTGYMAPECQRSNRVTQKSDVFSFGIVLLEFITGKKHIFKENDEEIYLSEWAAEKLKLALRGKYINLVDVKLKKKYDKEEMDRMIYCAAASVYKPEKDRPTMRQIVGVLEGDVTKEKIWKKQHEDYLSSVGDRISRRYR